MVPGTMVVFGVAGAPRPSRKKNTMDIFDLDSLVLIYENEAGDLFEQSGADLIDSGTLIDPETEEDLELIGWRKDS